MCYFFYCLVVYTPTSMGIILCFVTSSMFRKKFKALERITLPLNEVRYRLTVLKAKIDKFTKKINNHFLYQAVLNWASFTMLWIWQLVYVSTQKEYTYRTDFFAGWAAVYSFGFVVLLLPPALLTSRAELFIYRLKTKYCLNEAGDDISFFFQWLDDSKLGWSVGSVLMTWSTFARIAYIFVVSVMTTFFYFVGTNFMKRKLKSVTNIDDYDDDYDDDFHHV